MYYVLSQQNYTIYSGASTLTYIIYLCQRKIQSSMVFFQQKRISGYFVIRVRSDNRNKDKKTPLILSEERGLVITSNNLKRTTFS